MSAPTPGNLISGREYARLTELWDQDRSPEEQAELTALLRINQPYYGTAVADR